VRWFAELSGSGPSAAKANRQAKPYAWMLV